MEGVGVLCCFTLINYLGYFRLSLNLTPGQATSTGQDSLPPFFLKPSYSARTFTVLPFNLPADNLRTASWAMLRVTAT